MLNCVFMIGRVASMPARAPESSSKDALMTLNVTQPFTDESGIPDTTPVDVSLWRALSELVTGVCHPGSLVAVRGRLVRQNDRLVVRAETLELLDHQLQTI